MFYGNAFIRAAVVVFAGLSCLMSSPVEANDNFECGDGGGGSADIQAWQASIDFDGNLNVLALLCDSVDESIKYRLHIDHTSPYFDEVENCSTTSDDGMKLHRGKTTGPPGLIEVSDLIGTDDLLTFSVNMLDFPGVLRNDTINVWLDTQYKGIRDRVPDTDGSDGCSKPEVVGEAIPLTVPCVATLTIDGDGMEFNAVEALFTPPLSDFGGQISGELAWIGLGGTAMCS